MPEKKIVLENTKINSIIYYIDLRSLYIYKSFTKIFQILTKLNIDKNFISQDNFDIINGVDEIIKDYKYLLWNINNEIVELNEDDDILFNYYRKISLINITKEGIIEKIKDKINEQNEHIKNFLENLQSIFVKNVRDKFKEWIKNQDGDDNFLQIKKAVGEKIYIKEQEELSEELSKELSKEALKHGEANYLDTEAKARHLLLNQFNNLDKNELSSDDQTLLDSIGESGRDNDNDIDVDVDLVKKIKYITKVYTYNDEDDEKIRKYILLNDKFLSKVQHGGEDRWWVRRMKEMKEMKEKLRLDKFKAWMRKIKDKIQNSWYKIGSVAPVPKNTETPPVAINLVGKKLDAINNIAAAVQDDLTEKEIKEYNEIMEDIEGEVVNDIDIDIDIIYEYIEKDITDFITVADIAFKYIDIFSIYLDWKHKIPSPYNKIIVYGIFNELNKSRDFYHKKLDELKDVRFIDTYDVPYVSIYEDYHKIKQKLKVQSQVQSLGGRNKSIRKPRKNTNGTVKKAAKKDAKAVVKKTAKAVVKKTAKAVVKK